MTEIEQRRRKLLEKGLEAQTRNTHLGVAWLSNLDLGPDGTPTWKDLLRDSIQRGLATDQTPQIDQDTSFKVTPRGVEHLGRMAAGDV